VSQSVFVGRAAELRRLLDELAPLEETYGTRAIPVMVGPSGIGKTSLARKLQEKLTSRGFLPLFLAAISPPLTNEDLVNLLIRSLPSSLRVLEELVRNAVVRALDRVLGPDWDRRAPVLSQRLGSRADPLEFMSDLITDVAVNAKNKGYKGLVLIIDEAQNLLKGLRVDNLWSFIKLLSELQENPPGGAYFQSLLVTSDYMFQQRLFQSAPSIDYVDTFYLGEMTMGDAEELYARLCKNTEERDVVLDAVGGHPALLRDVCRREPHYFCRYVRKAMEFILVRLGEVRERDRGLYDEAVAVLRAMAKRGYVRISEALKAREAVNPLVERNILQYACKEYLGVYRWNRDCRPGEDVAYSTCGGGGFCGGLDVVAPSNRAILLSLYETVLSEEEKKQVEINIPGLQLYNTICMK
jgi:hypothetical protein